MESKIMITECVKLITIFSILLNTHMCMCTSQPSTINKVAVFMQIKYAKNLYTGNEII